STYGALTAAPLLTATLFPTRRSSDLAGRIPQVPRRFAVPLHRWRAIPAVLSGPRGRGRAARGGAVGRSRSHHSRQRHSAERLHRSEEHTSELQSLAYLVCRLLHDKRN